MLSELLRELNNWFDNGNRYPGEYTISDGTLAADFLQTDQYFRIVGSVFNDGVYKYPATELKDETFCGSVWALSIPREVQDKSDEIDAWCAKYAGLDSAAMSPYTSESFGGYSYSKGASGSDGGTGANWKTQFGSWLNLWRRPRCRY